MPNYRVLVVDDEPNVRSALRRALATEECEVVCASSAEEALEVLAAGEFAVLMTDEVMKGPTGTDLLRVARERYPGVVRILLTGNASLASALRAINEGDIWRYLTKPWDDADLTVTVRQAVERHALEAENRRLLAQVRQQQLTLEAVEARYPGITQLHTDETGAIILDDASDNDVQGTLAQLERESP